MEGRFAGYWFAFIGLRKPFIGVSCISSKDCDRPGYVFERASRKPLPVTDDARIERVTGDDAPDAAAAILAHELRGPLAVASGFLELADRATDDAARAYALGRARQALTRMDALIDDVLETFGPGGARASAKTGRVDVLEIVRELLLEPPNVEAGVRLEAGLGSYVVDVDRMRLERALAHILDNARKFSPARGSVRVEVLGRDYSVVIAIEDRGPGVPASDVDRVRERFERTRGDRPLPGFGLGLAVADELVEGMGGTLHIGSASDGTGARVEIVLPAADE